MLHTRYTRLQQIITALEMLAISAISVLFLMSMLLLA